MKKVGLFVAPVFITPSSYYLQLLLVLWKSFLACCGGVRDINRVKKLARELSGLPPAKENGVFNKHLAPSLLTLY